MTGTGTWLVRTLLYTLVDTTVERAGQLVTLAAHEVMVIKEVDSTVTVVGVYVVYTTAVTGDDGA